MVDEAPKGKRRPKDEDLETLLAHLWDGKSLRSACAAMGLDVPSTDKWLHGDEGRSQQYARACEGRADYLQEEALTITKASALGKMVDQKKVDPSGARAYLDAVKWANGRMAPKKEPVQRIEHSGSISTLTDDELAKRISALAAAPDAEDGRGEASDGQEPDAED